MALLLAGLPLLAAATPRPAVDLQCMSFSMGLQLECTVRLRGAASRPLSGATVTLGATMPSMLMAHCVKPGVVAATGTPGKCRGRLQLEMSRAWAVQIVECDGDRRCPVLPAAKAAPKP